MKESSYYILRTFINSHFKKKKIIRIEKGPIYYIFKKFINKLFLKN